MVREKGLEPSRLATLVPKTSVSTNSTTRAYIYDCKVQAIIIKDLVTSCDPETTSMKTSFQE